MSKFYLCIISLVIVAVIPFSELFGQVQKPTRVIKPAYFDVTQPLGDIIPIQPGIRDRSWKDNLIGNKDKPAYLENRQSDYSGPDAALQTYIPSNRSEEPIILQNFNGLGNQSGVAPPDTDGDVGPDHYFQMVNLQFAIYDKEGTMLYGPADNSTLWDGFIGPWTGTNDGDPIVLYDEHADRWLASQFALPNNNGPFYELIAISATGDPLGEWYRYAYEFERMPDYPKFGIWPDGYYFTINQFEPFDGPGVCVTDRDAMLEGDPDAELIFWDLPNIYFSLLPSDADGEMLPPEDSPAIMLSFDYGNLLRWEATVDWDNPLNSELEKMAEIPLASFSTADLNIKQPGTSWTLDPLADRLMYRLQYRNFGDYEVMLANHTVNRGFKKAGIRWYELRSEGGGPWEIYQQGTYGPEDDENRWMASIAMNQNGDIALGYSVSGENTYPSIRVAGQTSGAPEGLGVLDIPETLIYEGQDSQTGVQRWGDYSMMSIDPTDDVTFWFTTQYSKGGWQWKTRIASFGLPAAAAANFTANEIIIPVGEDVNFHDLSTGFPTEWEWTFTGGEPGTSTDENPQEIFYNTEGSFNVKLLASNDMGNDTEIKEAYITASTTILPDIHFFANNDFVCLGEEVKFFDLTRHVPIQWLWEFEPTTVTFINGTDQNSEQPEVIFDEADMYSVTLTAWNLNGQSSITKENYIIAGGIIAYYKETFEETSLASAYWTIESPDNTITWKLYESGGTQPGRISAGIDFGEYFSKGERDALISPPFNLTGASTVSLTFSHAYAQRFEDLTDSLIIYVSKNCSEEWVRVYATGEDGSGNFATAEPTAEFWPALPVDWCGNGWGASCIILDLNNWVGESGVRIAFESVANFGNPLFIDNVSIGQYVGNEEMLMDNNGIKTYPNPATNVLYIEANQNIQMVSLYNPAGQLIYSAGPTSGKTSLDLSVANRGLYFIRIETKVGLTTHKIIIE